MLFLAVRPVFIWMIARLHANVLSSVCDSQPFHRDIVGVFESAHTFHQQIFHREITITVRPFLQECSTLNEDRIIVFV